MKPRDDNSHIDTNSSSVDASIDAHDPMSTGGMSPTSMLLLRSEQQAHLFRSRSNSSSNSSTSGQQTPSSSPSHLHESDSNQQTAPVTPLASTAATTSTSATTPTHITAPSTTVALHSTTTNSSTRPDAARTQSLAALRPMSPHIVTGLERSNSVASDASNVFAPTLVSSRSESMSALATSANDHLSSSAHSSSSGSGALRIFASAADERAMKAILSPPQLRATTQRSNANATSGSGSQSTITTAIVGGGRSALSVLEATSSNLLEQGAKLLFRGVTGGSSSGGATASASAPASPTVSHRAKATNTTVAGTSTGTSINTNIGINADTIPKKPSGSAIDEDLAATHNQALAAHPTLPPPPFANMFACDNCREDIGTLLSKGRHHCRNCGGSFCAECSAKSITVPFDAFLRRGEQRVCDGCYHRIKDFQAQAGCTTVTWSGLTPPSHDVVTREFELIDTEVPVTTFNCSLFMDFSPFYGHLFLTRAHACFRGYQGHRIKVPYATIVSLLKPQFYYINALQVKTRRREKFFFAEFNGLRDLCFLRLDQLIRAFQDGCKQVVHVSPGDLVQQALVRRQSYKLLAGTNTSIGTNVDTKTHRSHTTATANAPPKSSSYMASPSKRDGDDLDQFLASKSTVGFLDMDDDDDDDSDDGDVLDDGVDNDDNDDDQFGSNNRPTVRTSSSRSGGGESRRTSLQTADDDDSDDKKSSASSDDDDVFEPLPPDAPLAKMTLLLDCELRADVQDVFELLWSDGAGQQFLTGTMERARDIDIEIGKWERVTPETVDAVNKGFVVSKEPDFTMHRRVSSQHPPKTTFPGLPAYATCHRVQRVRFEKTSVNGDTNNGDGINHERWDRFVVSDLLRMARIPFSDYFEIETRWVFSRDGQHFCHAQAGLVVNFLKSTWFKSQINSSTCSESKEVLASWAKQASEHLQLHVGASGRRRVKLSVSPEVLSAHDTSVSAPSTTPTTEDSTDDGTSSTAQTRLDERTNGINDTDNNDNAQTTPLSTRTRRRSQSDKRDVRARSSSVSVASSGVVVDTTSLAVDIWSRMRQQLMSWSVMSPVLQLLIVVALLYCLALLRVQQQQIEQLTRTTNALLERLLQQPQYQQQYQPQYQYQQPLGASDAPSGTCNSASGTCGSSSNLVDVCQQHIVRGAAEALQAFFAEQQQQ